MNMKSQKKGEIEFLDVSTNHLKLFFFFLIKKTHSKTIVFIVINDGSNVPDKDSNKIFERFYRGDQSRTSSTGGSGLGLSIAKSLADVNKWKINAESKLNQSMKITLTINL